VFSSLVMIIRNVSYFSLMIPSKHFFFNSEIQTILMYIIKPILKMLIKLFVFYFFDRVFFFLGLLSKYLVILCHSLMKISKYKYHIFSLYYTCDTIMLTVNICPIEIDDKLILGFKQTKSAMN